MLATTMYRKSRQFAAVVVVLIYAEGDAMFLNPVSFNYMEMLNLNSLHVQIVLWNIETDNHFLNRKRRHTNAFIINAITKNLWHAFSWTNFHKLFEMVCMTWLCPNSIWHFSFVVAHFWFNCLMCIVSIIVYFSYLAACWLQIAQNVHNNRVLCNHLDCPLSIIIFITQ